MAPRIGLYQPYPHGLGGTQHVVLNLAAHLPAHGYHPVIICPEEGVFTETARAQSIDVLISSPGNTWNIYGRGARALSYISPKRLASLPRSWGRLYADLRKNAITLVHFNGLRDMLLAAPAARLAGLPTLWHVHGLTALPWLEALAARLVQQIVLVSHGMIEYWDLPSWAIPRHRVVHNGLRLCAEHPRTSASARRNTDIVAVGVLHPRKGYETLLHAIKDVSRTIPNIRCKIVGGEWGDGSYGRHLRELSRHLGVEQNVTFMGHQHDVQAIMAESSVMAIPSRQETFGMVAVEAMIAGKPIVACKTGGLAEIVVQGETGFLVPPERSDLMAAALVTILQNPKLQEQMQSRGQQRAITCFSADRMAAAFAAIYTEMLQY
jgi:glycosyltransferase involved in cell wall biosynthesis